MPELKPRRPLADRGAFTAGGIAMREVGPTAWLVTASEAIDLPDAIAIGPREWLLLDSPDPSAHPALAGKTALCRDVRAGLCFVDLTGEGLFEMLGLSPIVGAEAGAIVTRLAMLRAIVVWRRQPRPWAWIAVERPSADYLWEWLSDRARLHVADASHAVAAEPSDVPKSMRGPGRE